MNVLIGQHSELLGHDLQQDQQGLRSNINIIYHYPCELSVTTWPMILAEAAATRPLAKCSSGIEARTRFRIGISKRSTWSRMLPADLPPPRRSLHLSLPFLPLPAPRHWVGCRAACRSRSGLPCPLLLVGLPSTGSSCSLAEGSSRSGPPS